MRVWFQKRYFKIIQKFYKTENHYLSEIEYWFLLDNKDGIKIGYENDDKIKKKKNFRTVMSFLMLQHYFNDLLGSTVSKLSFFHLIGGLRYLYIFYGPIRLIV